MPLLSKTIEEDWGSYRAGLRSRISRLTPKLNFLLCKVGIIKPPISESSYRDQKGKYMSKYDLINEVLYIYLKNKVRLEISRIPAKPTNC